MTWNYRIVKYRDAQGFGLHEVYYEDGRATARTADPCTFSSDADGGPEEIRESLTRALSDARARPVFNDPALWPTGIDGETNG